MAYLLHAFCCVNINNQLEYFNCILHRTVYSIQYKKSCIFDQFKKRLLDHHDHALIGK